MRPPASGPVVAATRQHAFIIPFRIEPPRSPDEQPVEVQLSVSSDQGITWEVASRVKPDQENFVYRAPHDGEYWYAIRTVDARGTIRPEGALEPQLKVVVDTVAPRLELTATRGEAGEISARWQAVDPHLKPTSFKLEYQTDPAGPWERVAVQAPPSAMRHTSTGEATWWPRASGGTINVRAEITDSAGNPAISQAVVKLDEGPGSYAGAPPVTPSTSGPSTGVAAESTRWPADRSSADPLGHGPGREPRASVGADNAYSDWRGATPPSTGPAAQYPPPPATPPADAASPRRDQVPRVAARPVAQRTRAGGPDSPLKFDVLPSGHRARMVNSREFELEYEVDSVGPSGIGKVELWGTLDGGRTWKVFGVDGDNRSPIPVRVEAEGIYGFRIVVVSGSGLGGQPPQNGDPADVWIGVDLAVPAVRITAAEVSVDGSELVITWEAADDALDVRPISLLFSESPSGPWTAIASGLENSGSYTWRFDERVPPLIYLRIEARDEAGNVGAFDLSNRVSLDRNRPEGHISGVRPVAPPAP